jgi:hypothetical protein
LKRFTLFLSVFAVVFFIMTGVDAGIEDCGKDEVGDGAKPLKEVNKEDPGKQNDYDKVQEEDERPGVAYLTFIKGKTPKPNKCGLNPSNDEASWTGWGGPLNCDNCTIGEGPPTRNKIVIGGIYFVRGIGTHGMATIEYDLTGAGPYVKFEAWVGMSDEKDPAECGHGGTSDFMFKINGKQVHKTDILKGTDNGKQVPAEHVEFDIPANAKKLEIVIGDGGDGVGCDHSALGDAKLLTRQSLAVKPVSKLPTKWGALKNSY